MKHNIGVDARDNIALKHMAYDYFCVFYFIKLPHDVVLKILLQQLEIDFSTILQTVVLNGFETFEAKTLLYILNKY